MVPHLNCDAAPVEDRWNSPVSSVLHPLNSSLNTLKNPIHETTPNPRAGNLRIPRDLP